MVVIWVLKVFQRQDRLDNTGRKKQQNNAGAHKAHVHTEPTCTQSPRACASGLLLHSVVILGMILCNKG